jgi:amino acid transporter
VAGKAGGHWLFQTINFSLLVASIGSGAGAHLGAGRLLYSMGRDNAIPRKFFSAINPRTRVPSNNILLIGGVMLIGVFTMSFALGCELLNFGALIAFMGVNLAALLHYYIRGDRKKIWNFLSPVIGFVVCAYLWWSLGRMAHIVGAIWLLTGILYGAWRTSFFRKPMDFAKLEDETKNR